MKRNPLDLRRNLVYIQFTSSDQTCNFIKKQTLLQVFSREFFKMFKGTYFHSTPLVAVSINSNSLF